MVVFVHGFQVKSIEECKEGRERTGEEEGTGWGVTAVLSLRDRGAAVWCPECRNSVTETQLPRDSTQGSHLDLRLFKDELLMADPSLHVMMSCSNLGETTDPIADQGAR